MQPVFASYLSTRFNGLPDFLIAILNFRFSPCLLHPLTTPLYAHFLHSYLLLTPLSHSLSSWLTTPYHYRLAICLSSWEKTAQSW